MAAKELLRADNEAVVVQSLRPGGAAAAAKPSIKDGDLILAVDGKPTPDLAALVAREPGNHRRQNRTGAGARFL